MKATLLLASTAVLALTAGAVASPVLRPTAIMKSTHRARHFSFTRQNSVTLYDQSVTSNSVAVVSQNFTDSSFTSYDSWAADDFVLPGTEKRKITAVFASGRYYGWPGPADSVNVAFYKKIKKGVGTLLKACPSEGYSDLSGTGAFLVDVSNCGVRVKGGQHRWVSAQANMAFDTGGEWYWNTDLILHGSKALWENPDNGFGTGCTRWKPLQACFPPSSGVGMDFAFALFGH